MCTPEMRKAHTKIQETLNKTIDINGDLLQDLMRKQNGRPATDTRTNK